MYFRALVGLVASLGILSSVGPAHGFSLDWSGTYRFTFLNLENSRLDGDKNKSYYLNHLELRPTVIATDDLRITSAFQVLPNSRYPSSKLGQFMGSGIGGEQPGESNTLGQNQPASSLMTTELYLTWEQEFGALIVGRIPVHFGLGMTHNGGFGAFDHWHDLRDIVGYKMTMGNFFIHPMIGQVAQPNPSGAAGMTERMLHVEYESEETGSLFGVFYENRISDRTRNDADEVLPDGTSTSGSFDSTRVNIAIGRSFENLDINVEGGIYSGKTGIRDSGGNEIEIDAFGMATEVNYRLPGSRFSGGVKFGYASGDDPETTDVYEGFVFDRNYDVAMFLMNHSLGERRDFFRTGAYREDAEADQSVDTESISNVMYIAPHLTWSWTDTLDVRNRLTYAYLNVDPNPAMTVSKSVGFEWDIDLIYQPHERVQWITQVGLIFPGAMFENGDEGLSKNFAYGFATKAAISF